MRLIQGKEYEVMDDGDGEWGTAKFVLNHEGVDYFKTEDCGYLYYFDSVREIDTELIHGAKYYVKNYKGEEWGKKPREFVFKHKEINYFESNVPHVFDYWNFFKKVHAKFEIGDDVTHLGSPCVVIDVPLDGLIIAKHKSGLEIVAPENMFEKL